MDTFKNITIRIPVDVYNRIERLSPRKRKGQNNVQEFWTHIFLDGLEHPRFINKENKRNAAVLEIQNSMLKQQLSVAQKQLRQESGKELPSAAIETVARNLDDWRDALAKHAAAPVTPNPVKANEQTTATAPKETTAPQGESSTGVLTASDPKAVVH